MNFVKYWILFSLFIDMDLQSSLAIVELFLLGI